jgi:inhibitor of KinA sporulation pathway (predicted exonuclease)
MKGTKGEVKMDKTRRIVIDLEMNPVSKGLKTVRANLSREIIEIGASMIDEQDKIVDEFHCLVKPDFNTSIVPFITNLTGITYYDVVSAVSLEKALNQLERWIGYDCETFIYSWSSADLQQMTKECEYKGIHMPPNMTQWIDFQSEYYRVMELDSTCRQLSLHKAAEQFGIIMDERKSHSALYDAKITAELLILILNGDYREQREYLRKTTAVELEDHSFTLGDACGNVLKQFLLQMQMSEEPVIVH